MSRKRICIVGPSKSFLSGISYYTIRLANALSPSNEISVLCLRKLLPEFLFPGRKRIGSNLSDLNYGPGIAVFDGMDYDSPMSWHRAMRFLKAEKPDIIILQWWTSSVAHLHLVLKMINDIAVGAKVILEMHEVSDQIEMGNLFLNGYSRFTGNMLQAKADMIVVHSESDRKLVAERYKIQGDSIRIVPHGLYDHYAKLDKPTARKKLGIQDQFTILYFGLIRPYKGVPTLVEAFDALPPDIASRSKLLIVGEMWEGYEEASNEIHRSKNKRNIITKFEYVSDEEIPVYFSACDVVALPYTRASQSGVAHIAMCFGKPIIVSEVGGLRESMAGYTGTIFVPPEDPGRIRDAIVNIYNRKGNEGHKAPDMGWEKISQMYSRIMEDI